MADHSLNPFTTVGKRIDDDRSERAGGMSRVLRDEAIKTGNEAKSKLPETQRSEHRTGSGKRLRRSEDKTSSHRPFIRMVTGDFHNLSAERQT